MYDFKKDSDDIDYLANSLSFRINDLENFYADGFLSDELKEMYAEVQNNCEDFRTNVFFKNLDIIEQNLVII